MHIASVPPVLGKLLFMLCVPYVRKVPCVSRLIGNIKYLVHKRGWYAS